MISVISKAHSEEFYVELIYWPPDLNQDETITKAKATVSPAGLTLSGPAIISGNKVAQKISRGEAGMRYKVLFKVTTSGGNIYNNPNIDAILVKVI